MQTLIAAQVVPQGDSDFLRAKARERSYAKHRLHRRKAARDHFLAQARIDFHLHPLDMIFLRIALALQERNNRVCPILLKNKRPSLRADAT